MCNGAAKQVSAGVAPCNIVGFVKLFRTSVARQVSRKVEPLSTYATVRNGRSGENRDFKHRRRERQRRRKNRGKTEERTRLRREIGNS